MNTSEQIFHCVNDGIDISKKWFSEEEIRKVTNKLFNNCPETHKGTYSMFLGELEEELFGDI